MKTAAANIPVYSGDGEKLIGQLELGQQTLVITEADAGTVIAYIIGLVKKEDAGSLIDEEEWLRVASETEKFITYAAGQVGCLYVSGGQGQKLTKALIRKLEKKDSNYKRALKQYEKNVEKGRPVVAYDCSGLIVAYLLDNGYLGRDLTANGIYYTICDAIDKDELHAGDVVCKKKKTSSRVYHIGIYMGDGTVVHAKGRDYGVVRESINAAGWNRYGRLKVFAQTLTAPTYSRTMKKTKPNMRGDDVRAAQIALLAKGFDPKGIDGIFGPKTEKAVLAFQKAAGIEVDGIIGPVTWGKLFEE